MNYFSGTIGGYDSVNQQLKDVIVVHPVVGYFISYTQYTRIMFIRCHERKIY